MVVTSADVPARLRVDPASLATRGNAIEGVLAQALDRAVANAGRQIAEAGATGGDLRIQPPNVVWTGPGLAEVPADARRRFEARVAAVVADAAKAAPMCVDRARASGPRTVEEWAAWAASETGAAVARPAPAPPPPRDERLEQALAAISAVAERHPQPEPAMTQVLEELELAIARIDPGDPVRSAALARAVRARFPTRVFLAFAELLEQRAAASRRELRGPTGMRPPGLLIPHLLLAPVASEGIDTERLGYAIASVEGFLGGVLDGFREQISAEELDRLAQRLGWTATFTSIFPVVFVAGAAKGIVDDVVEAITGTIALVRNLPEILHAVDEMLDIIFSPAGADVGRMIGLEIGRAKAKEIRALLAQNFVVFTFEIGRIVGPTIVYTIASLLGLPGVVLSALGVRLAMLLKRIASRFPRLAALLARAARLARIPVPDIHAPPAPHPHLPGPGAGLEQAVKKQLPPTPVEPPPAPPPPLKPPSPEDAEGITRGVVKGGKQPRIEGRRVPWRAADDPAPTIMDIEDIRKLPGENARKAAERVRTVITQRISQHKPLKDAWEAARDHVLDGRPLSSVTKQEMLGHPPYSNSLYNRVRDRFWHTEVPNSPAAKKVFADAGFDVSERKAPMLITDGTRVIPDIERRISLDHSAEKALAQNWTKGVDADNLVFEFHRPNSMREVYQVRFGMRDAPEPGWLEFRPGDPWPEPPK